MTAIPDAVQVSYGRLPDSWRLEKLKFVAAIRSSNVDKLAKDGEVPVRLCNYTDVYYNDRITSDLSFMEATATQSEIQRFQLRRGQVILTKDSESWEDIGVPALVIEDMPEVLCGYHLTVLEPRDSLHGGFLAWLCRSEPLNDQFKVAANGVTRYALGLDAMKDAFIALPPLDVQQRIAAFLDEKTAGIDALIMKKRALLERLAEKRQALITHAVTRGLNPDAPRKPSGIDWLGEIPAHWEVGNIRRFARMKTGHTPSRSVKEYWDDCTIPWFTLGDVWQLRDGTRWFLEGTAEKISELGLANSAAELLPAGTVVLSRTASVGYSGIMPVAMATSQDFWNWICGPRLTPEYLLLLFRSMRQKFEGIMSGSTHQTIYQSVAAGLEICLPPHGEQQSIATYVRERATAIDTVVERVRRSIAALTEYRSALVTAAVTGQVGSLLENNNVAEMSAGRPVPNAFKRAALAAYIADRLCDDPSFGKVKFQKALHLCEMHADAVEVEGNYFRQAAGPLDSQMMHSVHSQLKKQGWFDIEERRGGRGYVYRRGPKIHAYRKHFDRYFEGRAGTIDELLVLFAGMNTEQSEIVSTLYAAWNDLLLEGRDASPDAIIHLVLNEWAEEKRRISEDRWSRAIEWMRGKRLIPRGTGAHTRQRTA